MAGMLPGVELARRRRIHSRQNDHNRYSRCDFFLPERIQSSSTATTTSPVSTMDATALKARTRLEEKLGCFRSRWNKHPDQLPPPVQVRNSSHVLRSEQIQTSETEMRTRDIEVCRNNPQLSRRNSEREVCSVCLEELQGLLEVTNLPCSHRYHSDCLLTWLASHSHCPYCRSLVHSK